MYVSNRKKSHKSSTRKNKNVREVFFDGQFRSRGKNRSDEWHSETVFQALVVLLLIGARLCCSQ